MKFHYKVVDWSDDAYRQYGKAHVVARFALDKPLSNVSYDGGRVDIDGVPDTIWVSGNSFSIKECDENDTDEEPENY